jgi:tRNA threonylcarbamoyladenosine biosynthesis protein TsaB
VDGGGGVVSCWQTVRSSEFVVHCVGLRSEERWADIAVRSQRSLSAHAKPATLRDSRWSGWQACGKFAIGGWFGMSRDAGWVLGIDTCGPAGSVALGRLEGDAVQVFAEVELEGRNYSATLIPAVAELLEKAGIRVGDLRAIVAVNGPGSFTGVRIGLSAVKGLAEAAGTPVVSVSRLEVLARKSGVGTAALDAHRGEVFLRWSGAKGARETLAGAGELARLSLSDQPIAVCDESAGRLIGQAWPEAELNRVEAPTAADALRLCGDRFAVAEFVDLELLDGHYLRRSDAEIFGEAASQRIAGVPGA